MPSWPGPRRRRRTGKMEQMTRSTTARISDGRGGERGVGERTIGDGARPDRDSRPAMDARGRRRRCHEGVRTRCDRGGRGGGMPLHRGELRAGARRQAGGARTARTARALHRSPAEQQGAPDRAAGRRVGDGRPAVDRDRDRPPVLGGAGPDPGEHDRRARRSRAARPRTSRVSSVMHGRPASTSPG